MTKERKIAKIIFVLSGKEKMQQTLRERYQEAWPSTTTEVEYQEALRDIKFEAQNTVQAAQTARERGHQVADENIKKGLVWDPFREHALVNFYTGLVEDEASEIKTRAQRVLLVRRALSVPTIDLRSHQFAKLQRLEIII